jgi:hypothetical protein
MGDTMMAARRYAYRIEDPGGPQHGELLTFGPGSPPMSARERFTLANGRLVWIEYVGPAVQP